MNRIKLSVIRFAALAAVVLFCTATFILSSDSGEESTKKSGSITEQMAPAVIKGYEQLKPSGKKLQKTALETALRKAAHTAEYMAIGCSSALFALTFSDLQCFRDRRKNEKATGKDRKKRIPAPPLVFAAFLFCTVFAVLDEYHQSLVPGRSGNVEDAALDALAALSAAVILWGALHALKGRRHFPEDSR